MSKQTRGLHPSKKQTPAHATAGPAHATASPTTNTPDVDATQACLTSSPMAAGPLPDVQPHMSLWALRCTAEHKSRDQHIAGQCGFLQLVQLTPVDAFSSINITAASRRPVIGHSCFFWKILSWLVSAR